APHKVLDDSLARAVAGDEVQQVVALRRGVFGVETGVDVQARAVLQKHVRRRGVRDHLLEEIPRENVGRKHGGAVTRARHAILTLEAEDPALHLNGCSSKRCAPSVAPTRCRDCDKLSATVAIALHESWSTRKLVPTTAEATALIPIPVLS